MTARYRIPADAWSHLALVRDGPAIRIYANGRLIQDEPVPNAGLSAPMDRQVVAIGGRLTYRTRFEGQIDQVRIWGTARSAEQLRGAMMRHVPAEEPRLLAAWRFDEGRGEIVRDVRGRYDGLIADGEWARVAP